MIKVKCKDKKNRDVFYITIPKYLTSYEIKRDLAAFGYEVLSIERESSPLSKARPKHRAG